MTALTKSFPSSVREVTREPRPVAANAKGFKGGLAIALLAGASKGFYKQADGASIGVVVGRFYEDFDNTGGADGAISAQIHFLRERHLYLVANDTGTPLAAADRESVCYALDDQTVTKAPSDQHGGIVYDVTSEGVWIEIAGAGGADQEQIPAISNIPEHLFDKAAADGAAATATAEHSVHVSDGHDTVLALKYVPDAALVHDAANNATLTVSKRDGLGGAASTVATITTSAADWTAFEAVDLGAITGGALAAGTILTFKITKNGTGVVVPAGKLVATFERA